MLKIGEFSRLSQVTVATLHHYDDIGLLKPAHIDEFTNYRYYTMEQLPRIHRIMVLKELGLSLDQIALMVDSELPTAQLRGMLTLKEAEMQQLIDEEMTRLARIKFHIRQIDMEADMSQLDIRIKTVESVRALTLRILAKDHGDIERVGREFMPLLLEKKLIGAETTPARPFQIVYAKEYHQTNVDMEFVIPVPDQWQDDLPLPTQGTMTIRGVPGIEAAATYIYHGDPDKINENLVDLDRWVVANGYKLSEQIRMVILRFPYDEHKPLPDSAINTDNWMMEIQHPLEKV